MRLWPSIKPDSLKLWSYRVDSIGSVLWALARLYFVYTGGYKTIYLAKYGLTDTTANYSENQKIWYWVQLVMFIIEGVSDIVAIFYAYMYFQLFKTVDKIKEAEETSYTLE